MPHTDLMKATRLYTSSIRGVPFLLAAIVLFIPGCIGVGPVAGDLSGVEHAELAENDDVMPYSMMAGICQRFSRTLSPHVTVRPYMTASPKKGTEERPDLYFVIHAADGDIRVDVAPDGSFDYPIRHDLVGEDPQVSVHGFENGGSFQIVANFKKGPAEKKEEIRYSEIMLPYTYGAQAQRDARARNPNVPVPKPLVTQILIARNPSEPLVIKAKNGDILLEPTAKGAYKVPFSAELIAENPFVVFPTNEVRLGAFIPEETAHE